MKIEVNPDRVLFERNKMIYGHFLEHFHRQVYGGVYDPGNPLSDETGLRKDVLDAMKEIEVPILRWPGGCFVSAYHWQDGVGPERVPSFNKAWRVEDPNTFGTDEYIDMCRKIGCEPYICTNAGTGSAEEMSDWAEYCNLENEGKFAKMRIANGHKEPYNVKYWSIGNENYADWEIGAKTTEEWSRLVNESAKMILHVDPSAELSAAALHYRLGDVTWTMNVLQSAGHRLKWVSVHKYWDRVGVENNMANYEQSMALTYDMDGLIQNVRGILTALSLEKKIKIAFDEWNLRNWYHPHMPDVYQPKEKEGYLPQRDKNDDNSTYTMADTVFTACFLNTCNRNADIVGMANFAPIINTRGCIYTYKDGIVLRGTYHVFRMYVKLMGEEILDLWKKDEVPTAQMTDKFGIDHTVELLDVLATKRSDGVIAISAINKAPAQEQTLSLKLAGAKKYRLHTLNGESTDSYNDIGIEGIKETVGDWTECTEDLEIKLDPHSVNVIEVERA